MQKVRVVWWDVVRLENYCGLPRADALRTAKTVVEFKAGCGIGTMVKNEDAPLVQWKLGRKPRCLSLATDAVKSATNSPHLGDDFKMKFGIVSRKFRKADGIVMLAEYDVNDESGFTKEHTGSRIEQA